ncbi:MAG: EamA family transporter [Candidatus Thorarchaeota archaeon]|nr:EamA family transporter [Candidatus Thorarchaeota archaeon]
MIGSVSSTQSNESDNRVRAIVQACFVTILWSSSWVIIKFGLEEIPPLLFAGLRYFLASLLLVALVLSRSSSRKALRKRSSRWWIGLALYGGIFITATQGTQFLALKYLPAITFSLLLNLTPIFVLILAIPWLRETPSLLEIVFIIISLLGVFLYFYPLDLVGLSLFGLMIGIVSLIANSFSSIIGRAINRIQDTPALIVTGISMFFGASMLILLALATETLVTLSLTSWISIVWLAVVNTAFAFTLWNRSMQVLRAIDTTLINSTMMPQIVILSIIFLGEFPDLLDWLGLILLALGITAVQVIQSRKKQLKPENIDSESSTGLI